jgi:hypothetical protein
MENFKHILYNAKLKRFPPKKLILTYFVFCNHVYNNILSRYESLYYFNIIVEIFYIIKLYM